jgi:hypothetical protein
VAYDREVWQSSVDNGQIPRNRLARIWPTQFDFDLQGPAVLQPEAALAMGALLRQAWEHGARDLRVKFSYRTFAKQVEKWRDFQNGGNLAAEPGTSNHGWAVAVDFTGMGPDEITWLRRNARRYGYVNDVPSEIWHYTYQEHVWGGSELTEDEKRLLTWLEGFQRGATENLAGTDTGGSVGKRLAEAAKHADSNHVSVRHEHREGRTGPPVDTPDGLHTHREGTSGPPVEP